MSWAACFSPTWQISPFSSRCLMACLATEPFTFRRSLTTEGVMSLALGISFIILSYVALSNMTMFASFSLTLPLLHFFFLERPPAIAAFILASLDFWTTLLAPMAPAGGGPRRERPRARGRLRPGFRGL